MYIILGKKEGDNMDQENKQKKRGRGCLIVVLIILGLITAIIIGFLYLAGKNAKSYDTMDYSNLDLSQLEDGSYVGSEDGGMVKAKVEVTVTEHQITKVTILEHECGTGKPAEAIVDQMVKDNRIDVDGVSGATLSSDVIKTAVYNALMEHK